MADNRPKEFKSYPDAITYATRLAYDHGGTRYVGPLGPGRWLVGTYNQLHTQMGLEPLVQVGTGRRVRRTQEAQKEIYIYWRNTGDISKTAKKFDCSESNVYRIIHIFNKEFLPVQRTGRVRQKRG